MDMNTIDVEVKAHIDDLYRAACARHSTYESVIFTDFCSQMLRTYGDDEHALKAIDAFNYARSEHGYLSPTEIKAFQAKDWDNGYCTHGLTWMTCPCGCFEIDEDEDEDEEFDFSAFNDAYNEAEAQAELEATARETEQATEQAEAEYYAEVQAELDAEAQEADREQASLWVAYANAVD
ncbi:regulator [Pseudomonas cichorii]|uniref:regulator n=1 Tax=Pseudomonas cichorii TaxID=36746 RepID=UPI0018E5FE4B|nr:regulator [Pseudomonas cichorii]MBI6855916.1 regulator [Pseudomonas cichorii]